MYYQKNRGKIVELVKKLQIADSDGYWYRNTITLEKIRNSNKYRDEIVDALEEERKHFMSYVNEHVEDNVKEFKTPKEIHLGGWFYELLYKPSVIKVMGGGLKVKEHYFSSDYSENSEAEEDEDVFYETDNCSVDLRYNQER